MQKGADSGENDEHLRKYLTNTAYSRDATLIKEDTLARLSAF